MKAITYPDSIKQCTLIIILLILRTAVSHAMEQPQTSLTSVPSLQDIVLAKLTQPLVAALNATKEISINDIEKVLKSHTEYEKKLPQKLRSTLMRTLVQKFPSVQGQINQFALRKTITRSTSAEIQELYFNPTSDRQLVARHLISNANIINWEDQGTDSFIELPGEHIRITYTADGAYVASIHENHINLYDSVTGHLVRTLDGGDGYFSAITYNPAHNTIIAGKQTSTTVSIWNPYTGEQLQSLDKGSLTDQIICNASGTEIVTLNSMLRPEFTAWNLQNDTPVVKSEYALGNVGSITYNPRNNNVVFNFFDLAAQPHSTVTVWDRAQDTFTRLYTLEGSVTHIAYNPDPTSHQMALSVSNGKTYIVTGDTPLDEAQVISQPHKHRTRATYNAKGTLLAITSDPNVIHLYKNEPIIPVDALTTSQIFFLALTSELKKRNKNVIIHAQRHPTITEIYEALSKYRQLKDKIAQRWEKTSA